MRRQAVSAAPPQGMEKKRKQTVDNRRFIVYNKNTKKDKGGFHMKLAEALIERAELQRKNAELLKRINDNVLVQEGDDPAEQPEELMAEYEKNRERLLFLVRRINATNQAVPFDGEGSVADAIIRRDNMKARIGVYRSVCASATIRVDRYSQKEVRYVRCIDPKELQAVIDRLSKEYRELDTKLQGINWTVDLL